MALAAGTKLGQYEVRELISEGGMGEVYKARDKHLDRTVEGVPNSVAGWDGGLSSYYATFSL